MNLTDITATKEQELFDWYWTYGSKRKGAYSLSRGGWFERLCRTLSRRSEIRFSEEHFRRPAVAIWGPSQSGKSTLLAEFIDHGEGALNWAKSESVRFVPLKGKGKALNPNNRGSDASGCVARYVMRERVEFPETPVEIHLAKERDILMSLAFGYLSETTGKNAEGEHTHFNAETLGAVLDDFEKRAGTRAEPRRENFQRLVAVADVLEALVRSKQERYANLESRWDAVRSRIFDCDALLATETAPLEFAARVFWDDWRSLTKICTELFAKRDALSRRFSGKRIFCSLSAAALLLDISAAENADRLEEISGFGFREIAPDAVALASGTGAFLDAADVARTQALVAVLTIPLRADVLRGANGALHALLNAADIVDFPGVANEAPGTSETRLTDAALAENEILGMTKVFKRGKTASVVIGYSRNLDIDVFAILMRMNGYAPKPDQLEAGVSSWFLEMLSKTFDEKTAPELPLNIVQTFAAALINSVGQLAIGKDGLKKIFDKNNGLGTLCRAGCVRYFAVNYPAFKPECDFDTDSRSELEARVAEIEKDRDFRAHYSGTEESLRQMCGLVGPGGNDGGRTFLFEKLLGQIRISRRRDLLEAKTRALAVAFDTAMSEALPADGDENARRREDVEKIIEHVDSRARLDCSRIADAILKFTNVDPETLPPLPENLADDDGALGLYCEKTLAGVKDALTAFREGDAIGLGDSERRSRVTAYLLEGVAPGALKEWIRSTFPENPDRHERDAARRALAFRIARLLFRRQGLRHRPESSAPAADDVYSSPNYIAVVAPFLESLQKLHDENASARAKQPGDDELRQILLS